MSVVWKFPVTGLGAFKMLMPEGTQVLDVQMQGNEPMVWAVCDPSQPREERRFRVHPTGVEFASYEARYIGTFQLQAGSLIFHLFEER